MHCVLGCWSLIGNQYMGSPDKHFSSNRKTVDRSKYIVDNEHMAKFHETCFSCMHVCTSTGHTQNFLVQVKVQNKQTNKQQNTMLRYKVQILKSL